MTAVKVPIPAYLQKANISACRQQLVEAFCAFYEQGVYIRGKPISETDVSNAAFIQSALYRLLCTITTKGAREIEIDDYVTASALIEGKTGLKDTLWTINRVWDCYLWQYQEQRSINDISKIFSLVELRDALSQFVTQYFSEWLARPSDPPAKKAKSNRR